MTYRCIQVCRCSRLWLVYLQVYVPVSLGVVLFTCIGLGTWSLYSQVNDVVDRRDDRLPWQPRLKTEPTSRTRSVLLGRTWEFSRIHGGSGEPETSNQFNTQSTDANISLTLTER